MEVFGWTLLVNILKGVAILLVAPFTLTLKYTIMYWPQIKVVLPYVIAAIVLRIGYKLVVRTYTPIFRVAARLLASGWNHVRASYSRQSQTSNSKCTEEQTSGTEGARPQPRLTPYEILGVQPGASPDEIKAAYRTAMVKNHPDKVAHLDPALQELAAARAKEIAAAFSHLCGR